jgi:hypothetical protein
VTGRAPGRLLSPQRARTLYALADALLPPVPTADTGGSSGGGGVDVAPLVEARLALTERARVWEMRILLFLLEWWPRLALRGRRGFSWLSRAERLQVLEGFQHGTFRRCRRASSELRALVLGAANEALGSYSLPGA